MTSDSGSASRSTRAKAAALIAVPLVCGYEGLRTYVYRDPVGIPTYCFGETSNPDWSKQYTVEECTALVRSRIDYFVAGVQSCVKVPLEPWQLAAFSSAAYNIGLQAFCTSSMQRFANAGNMEYACDALLKWNRATVAGVRVTIKGLTNRREKERLVCLGVF